MREKRVLQITVRLLFYEFFQCRNDENQVVNLIFAIDESITNRL